MSGTVMKRVIIKVQSGEGMSNEQHNCGFTQRGGCKSAQRNTTALWTAYIRTLWHWFESTFIRQSV